MGCKYRLTIPAKPEIAHRDVRSMTKAELVLPRYEDFKDLPEAEAQAIALIKDEGSTWTIPHELKIERLSDGKLIHDYDALKQMAEDKQRKG